MNTILHNPISVIHSIGNTNKDELLLAKVASLDFSRMKHKYTNTEEAAMSSESWDTAEQEYRRYLSLKCLYPKACLVPSKLVDQIWHAHILDTAAYRKDSEHLFGYFLDHYPYFGIYGDDDYRLLQDAFSETVTLYEKHFGDYPNKSPTNATRCGDGDHSCHAPSSCACRTSGACK